MIPTIHDAFEGLEHDLPLWCDLAARCGGPVLEVGCGTGRVLDWLASQGQAALGLERDEAAVARARERLGSRAGLRLLEGDALHVELGERFPLVIGPARVAEELAAQRSPVEAIAGLARFLTPRGWLALAVAAPPPAGQPEQSMGIVHRLELGRLFGPAEVLWEERLDRAARLREVTVFLRPLSEAESPRFQAVARLLLRWASLAEWTEALIRAGLSPVPPNAVKSAGIPSPGPGLQLLLARAP